MYIGKPLRRDEDYRFLTGSGQYTGDIDPGGAAHVVFVRSPHAHARIAGIATETAQAMPGVRCVLDATVWDRHGLGIGLPCSMPLDFDDGRPMNDAVLQVFARDEVHHVGDPVAAVVADTPGRAQDAAEAVEVDYRDLPAVTDVRAAAAPDAPLLHEQFGSNIVFETCMGDAAAAERALAGAAHVTELEIRNTRITSASMEPRTYLGCYHRAQDRYTLYASTQFPHALRKWLCRHVFGLPLPKIRVVAPDVGGGFGTKAYLYPEMPVVLLAAKLIGSPVLFVAARSEAFASDAHARDYLSRARLGFDADGTMVAISVDTLAGFGAYQSTFNALIAGRRFGNMMTGMYRIAAAHVRVTGVYANAQMVDAYRGVGASQYTVLERLVENGARELGFDPAELREANYLRPADYPYTNPLDTLYDSGNPGGQQTKLLETADYRGLRERRGELQEQGEHVGIGMAAFVDHAGMGPSRGMQGTGADFGTWEGGRVNVHEDGRVSLYVGTHSHGQGHEITFRQLAADTLGIDIALIDMYQGDTDRDPGNTGTGAMRSLISAGMAVVEASERVVAKGKRLAAHLMEAADADVEYESGRYAVAGTDRTITFSEVARMAYIGADYPQEGFDLGLDETVYYDPVADTFPTGMHLALVAVDVETGNVDLREYYTVDDCGRVINPMIVAGQVMGGIAQGVGLAVLEQIVYDEGGQLLSGSFMDYAMPRADMLPRFNLGFQETLSPCNSLGVKGVGECGTNGPASSIGNAIVDALWDRGVRHIDIPYTPLRVWEAIRVADRQA